MSTPAAGVQITVQLGAWQQTWTVPEHRGELDAEAVELVNAEGCVLDGLTAQWSAADLMSQPSPVVCSFAVYVPASATSRPTLTGPGSVTIVPPGYAGPDDGTDPLLDVVGTVLEGDATPLAEGLRFDVTLTDHLADLGERRIPSRVAGGLPSGYGYPDFAHWDHQLNVIAGRLAARGLNYDPEVYDIDLDLVDFVLDPVLLAGYYATLDAGRTDPGVALAMSPHETNPYIPDQKGEPVPANELLDVLLRAGTKWSGWQYALEGEPPLQDYRISGVFNWIDYQREPPATHWSRYWLRPVLVPCVDPAGRVEYRHAWTSPRVEGDAGLPLRWGWTGSVLELVERARVDGAIPSTTRHGAWLPAEAAAREGTTWRIDKDRHPSRASATGWMRDWSHPRQDILISTEEKTVGWGSIERDHGMTERQLDLSYFGTYDEDKDPAAVMAPDYLLWAELGFYDDAQPRYTLESVTIAPEHIPDPRSWPRLFQQRDHRRRDWHGGAMGRFIYLHGLKPEWHPTGRTRLYGQLTGATLTLSGGVLRMVAQLGHRRTGPNGPRGAHPDPTSTPEARDLHAVYQLTGSRPESTTWLDFEAAAAAPVQVTWAQLDPTATYDDMWLTERTD